MPVVPHSRAVVTAPMPPDIGRYSLGRETSPMVENHSAKGKDLGYGAGARGRIKSTAKKLN